MIEIYEDVFEDEDDLICVDIHDIGNDEPYFVDKEEVINMLKNNKIHHSKKIYDNVYLVDFFSDLLYFICPLNARNEVKKWWEDILFYLKQYEVKMNE